MIADHLADSLARMTRARALGVAVVALIDDMDDSPRVEALHTLADMIVSHVEQEIREIEAQTP